MLDTRFSVETPEGVDLSLAVAGPAPRALAWVIDSFLRLIGYGVVATLLAVLGTAGEGLFLIVLFLGEWFYPVLFEVKGRGATPGKRALGLIVLHDDGTPVGWSAALIRNLLRFADFLPLAYGFGLASMLIDRRFRRLGDLAAGTLVVHREPMQVSLAQLRPVAALAPPVLLQPEEQRAVVDFARRRSSWTDDRAAELANAAAPLTGARGGLGAARLEAMAAWLLGSR
ncbi:MAG: RDD family protein [Thermoanaerobaculia bacterium]|nr:RDD family protein [Thermoanaerobaculia bacterium]